jgi:hypothetical protein
MEQEKEIIVEEIIVEKKKRGRPRIHPLVKIIDPDEIKVETRGRKNTSGVNHKSDSKEYFQDYYIIKGGDVICECGMEMNKFCLNRHLKRKIHIARMATLFWKQNLKINEN